MQLTYHAYFKSLIIVCLNFRTGRKSRTLEMSAEVDLTSPSAKKTFQCTICPNTFTSASRLKRHEGAHSDQRPFECKICSKTFKYRDNMKTHEKMHKSPYPCQTCHREFISWQAVLARLQPTDPRPYSYRRQALCLPI